MKTIYTLVVAALFFCVNCFAQPRQTEERPPNDSAFYPYKDSMARPEEQSNIRYSLSQMANANCRKGNVFKVLFYGQSITEQGWWKRIVEFLEHEYPDVQFEIENRAIGGHDASMLLKTAEADVYKYYPDLLIFHAYGSHLAYENLIQNIRERTTADVIIANDHITKNEELTEEISPWKLIFWRYTRWIESIWVDKPNYHWNAWMNYVFLPNIAKKFDLEFVDMRTEWKKYLKKSNLKPNALLIDDVHLNANGEYLMAEVIKTHLTKKVSLYDKCFDEYVKDFSIDRMNSTIDRTVQFTIEGNRFDLILDKSIASNVSIKIDGLSPSKIYNSYYFSRTSSYPDTPWPALLQVHKGITPPQEEEWSACVTPSTKESDFHIFELSGSITGPDGSGQTNKNFVSSSKKIAIDADDWNLKYSQSVWKKNINLKTCFYWNSISTGPDIINTSRSTNDIKISYIGLSNKEHHIELRTSNPDSIKGYRTFRPPIKCLILFNIRYCI